MFAARNIRLCTKDCACLMVCPTGATDTENGQIDESKCLAGCRLCVDACPSHAIYLVSTKTATHPAPEEDAAAALDKVLALTAEIRSRSSGAAEGTDVRSRFLKALAHSSRVLAEDCWREHGYLSLAPSAIGSFMASEAVVAAYEACGGVAAKLQTATSAIRAAVSTGTDLGEEAK
jgi:NAD-dependent dihydropyrimidine dehydrogenase PreA subunit